MDMLKPYMDNGVLKMPSGQTKFSRRPSSSGRPQTAQKRMETILTAAYTGKKLDGVLSPYDGLSRGIISALTSTGGYAKEPPIVTGQDAEKALGQVDHRRRAVLHDLQGHPPAGSPGGDDG